MLLLDRGIDERITIDTGHEKIIITVTDFYSGGPMNRGRVVLGLDAPKHVRIYRDDCRKGAPVDASR